MQSVRSASPVRLRVRPATDILEKDDVIEVFVNMPGVTRQNMSVEMNQNEMVIKGFSTAGQEAQKVKNGGRKESVISLEFVDIEFGLRLALHDTLDKGAIKATLRDGVLALRMPMLKRRSARSIPIQVE